MSPADRAAALVSWWVATYTRQLPGEVGERRRAEVASDLWEQRSAARHEGTPAILVALSILWRMAAGMRADLRWRSSHLTAAHRAPPPARRQRLLDALARNWWLVLAGLVGVTEMVVGAAIAVSSAGPATGSGSPERAGPTVGGGTMIMAAGLILLLGIVWRRRRPNAGTVLIVAGAIPALVLSPWALPLILVVLVGLDLAWIVRPGGQDAGGGSVSQLAMRLASQVTGLSVLYLVLAGRVPLWAGLGLLGLLAVGYSLRRRDRPT